MKRRIKAGGLVVAVLVGVSGSVVLFPHVAGARTAGAAVSGLRVERAAPLLRAAATTLARAHGATGVAPQHRSRSTIRRAQASRVSATRGYSSAGTSSVGALSSSMSRTGAYGTMSRYAAGRTGTCAHMTGSASSTYRATGRSGTTSGTY